MDMVKVGAECVCKLDGTLVRCVYDGPGECQQYRFHKMPSGDAFSIGPMVFQAGVYTMEDKPLWPKGILDDYHILLMKENQEKADILQKKVENAQLKFDEFSHTAACEQWVRQNYRIGQQFKEFSEFMSDFAKKRAK